MIHAFRNLTMRTSNRHANNIIASVMFRLAIERDECTANTSFEDQQAHFTKMMKKSIISTASCGLRIGQNTIISHTSLSENLTASLNHLKRISDFIERGDGIWYKSHSNGAIEFFDGVENENQRVEGPRLTHFR